MASSAARSGIAHEAIAVAWSAAVSAATLALALCAGILMRDVQRGLTPDPWAPLRIAALPPLPVIDADAFVHGRALFTATCATCHGPKGTGVAGLGKDLTHSRFVCDLDDPGLVPFLKQGRDVTD
ncbi:MAG: cytochrome c, partial [Phycisphaerales bacterium]